MENNITAAAPAKAVYKRPMWPAGRTAVYVAQLVWCSSGRTEDF